MPEGTQCADYHHLYELCGVVEVAKQYVSQVFSRYPRVPQEKPFLSTIHFPSQL